MVRIFTIAGYADSLIGFRGMLLDGLVNNGMDVYVAAFDLTRSLMCQKLEARRVNVRDIYL